jgi:hypothetical protein
MIKANALTSFHYPTSTLATYLQMLLKDDGNATDSLAHPSQGPFQVVQDQQGCLLLANKKR